MIQAAVPAAIPNGALRRLVNEFQRDLPLSPRPFRDIGARLEWTENAVLEALSGLVEQGMVSRVGPVIRPNTIGVSALAAMAVPRRRLEAVAAIVNRQPEVNHNYQREHRFNLWFVVTAAGTGRLDAAIRRIEGESGLPVMVLPMLDDYYIDLGFDLEGGAKNDTEHHAADRGGHRRAAAPSGPARVDHTDRRLLQAIQDGLPLVARPYAAAGVRLGIAEAEVRARLAGLLESGIIKRLGVVVRHHECGYRHNAMAVWDVPDEAVHEAGRKLALVDAVRLCYRRPRRLPHWPYNLFCMIHGRDRQSVLAELEHIAARTGLDRCPGEVLFSLRRFKQRGARYDLDAAPARENPRA